MTAPNMPSLPNPGDKPWDAWADDLHAVVGWLLATVQVLVPVNGPVITVNGLAPDGSGNVTLTADSVQALASSYKPDVAALPPFVFPIVKDPVTSLWPSGWDAGWNPTFVGAATNQAARPTADQRIVCEWQCADGVFPPEVASGTGGMLKGRDRKIITG